MEMLSTDVTCIKQLYQEYIIMNKLIIFIIAVDVEYWNMGMFCFKS